MNIVKIGKIEYNLDSVSKKSKSEFKAQYKDVNPNWEQHYDILKPTKKKANIEKINDTLNED